MAANLMPGVPRTELIACAGFVHDRNAVAIPETLYCDAITFDTTVSSCTGEASPEKTGNALNFGGTSRGMGPRTTQCTPFSPQKAFEKSKGHIRGGGSNLTSDTIARAHRPEAHKSLRV